MMIEYILTMLNDLCTIYDTINALTLFRMGGGPKSPPPTSHSPVTSKNVGTSPQNFVTLF